MSLYNRFLIQTYNIGIIRKDIGDVIKAGIGRGDITWLKHSYRDRYFADPFLINEDEAFYYILVEEYLFWEEKGKITLLTIRKEDFSLVTRKVVIEEETHLSFPFCDFRGSTIIPESVKSGKTKCYDFNLDMMTVTDSHEIIEEGLIDAAFYTDKNHEEWVFTAKSNNPKVDMYMYHKEKGKYIPLNNNQVIASSIEETRSAGRLFENNQNLYRPVQDSTGRYGRQTRIMHVEKIDTEGYKASCIQVINSAENPPFDETLHTFNVYDDCIIVDGSKDYLRFPMKLFYKKCRCFFNWKNREGKVVK